MCNFRSARIVLAVMLFVGAFAAHAGQQTGVVDKILVRQSDGLVYFIITGTATGKPSCAANSYWMISDENSEAGKRILATVMMAKAMNAQISVSGNNTCTRWPDGEDVLYIQLL